MSTNSRKLFIVCQGLITDYEAWGSNVLKPFDSRRETILNENQSPIDVIKVEEHCGGEIRIEIDATAVLDVKEGVRVSGQIRLYEGATSETTDLDGLEKFETYVAKNGTVKKTYYVWNRNENQSDDKVEFTMTLTNRPS